MSLTSLCACTTDPSLLPFPSLWKSFYCSANSDLTAHDWTILLGPLEGQEGNRTNDTFGNQTQKSVHLDQFSFQMIWDNEATSAFIAVFVCPSYLPLLFSFICFSLLYKHTYEHIIHWPTEKADWRVRPENPRNCINTSVLEPTRQDGCIDQLVVSGDKTRDARRWQNCFISWSAAERAVANKWHNINKWPSDHHVSKVQKKQQCA